MTVIGITGPTGAGKTTALNELRALGALLLDADAVYHELLSSDTTLQQELARRFGDMRDKQGSFDRKKLGAVVFHDPAALADLNAISHRCVVAELKRRLDGARAENRPAAAIDAIALFESGADALCGVTVAVTAPIETRVQRIMTREGISEAYARARVSAQRPDGFYTERCDYVLSNDCADAAQFAARARALFASILHSGANC